MPNRPNTHLMLKYLAELRGTDVKTVDQELREAFGMQDDELRREITRLQSLCCAQSVEIVRVGKTLEKWRNYAGTQEEK